MTEPQTFATIRVTGHAAVVTHLIPNLAPGTYRVYSEAAVSELQRRIAELESQVRK